MALRIKETRAGCLVWQYSAEIRTWVTWNTDAAALAHLERGLGIDTKAYPE
jgi:hypothetical protein